MKSENIDLHSGFAGWYKIEAHRVDADGVEIPGSRRIAADWFPNLITDAGLNFLGTVGTTFVHTYCRVGSGNTPPVVTDTALVSEVASSNTLQNNERGADRSGAFYGWNRRTLRFATGVAAGTLTEVGVSPAATGALFSRALILDTNGNPTAITVLSDEVLDVTYELRLYPVLADATGTVNIAGESYSWTARPLIPAAYDIYWGNQLGGQVDFSGATFTSNVSSTLPEQNAEAASTNTASSVTRAAYVAGSFARNFTLNFGLNNGNISGGIGAFISRSSTVTPSTGGVWAWGLSPKLPKTDQYVATFTVRMTWGRYEP